jgi:hypothetical protein
VSVGGSGSSLFGFTGLALTKPGTSSARSGLCLPINLGYHIIIYVGYATKFCLSSIAVSIYTACCPFTAAASSSRNLATFKSIQGANELLLRMRAPYL